MPDLTQKQSGEKQLAVPTTRFSSKYFFPGQKYAEAKPAQAFAQEKTSAPATELFQTPLLAQQTILPMQQKTEFTMPALAAHFRERLNSLFALILVLFSSKYAQRRRQGALALKQLKYLAALCSATSSFTNDEALLFQAAFGEAYYNVLQAARSTHNKPEEQALHLHSSFKSLLRATDSV
ncbi:Uncharacterised protein [Candidatus Anstonella stagnisolia]|nr:Uncharacterised protein [Candidatus Anstonella stagnisolia]